MSDAGQLQELLGLETPPVAVTFADAPPAGVPRVDRPGPSSCSYWKQAAEGQAFYTEASDHYNCPVGSYTHGVDLPPEQAKELEGLVGTMVQLDYLRMEEVPGIPRRTEPFRVAIYRPLAAANGDADVVLVRGDAKQIMLLAEAALAAGAAGPMMGRPTCAAIPEAIRSGHGVASLGCIGNRVYTGLGDDELYYAIPGARLEAVTERLATIVRANQELEKFHEARAAG
jgi:uncharacterized protein (DUF169 family)